jgi:hypothetical protein
MDSNGAAGGSSRVCVAAACFRGPSRTCNALRGGGDDMDDSTKAAEATTPKKVFGIAILNF